MPKKVHTKPQDSQRYMGYSDASEYVQLSQRKLAELVSRKQLRAVRVGKRVVFDSRDLDMFMADAKR